ncbi:MAG: GTP-binding protein [Candidatus Hydrothermarchaeales archaeon]
MLDEKIKEIEDEIRRTPYNKATQRHIGILKAKLAKLKKAERTEGARSGSKEGYSIRKAGNATILLIGLPSVGKSTLLNRLTNASSKVADYAFTTLKIEPGILEYKGARMQILDAPGLIKGAASGRGRGREILSIARAADLILILIDVFNLSQLDVISRELWETGLRLDRRPPNVRIKQKSRGGLNVNSTIKLTKLDEETVKDLLRGYGMHNAEVVIRQDINMDEFLDALAGNRIYIPSLIVLNKMDLVKKDYLGEVRRHLPRQYLPISAAKGTNLDELKEAMFQRLNFIRVYLKPQGEKSDLEEPMIVLKNTTVGDLCDRLHTDLKKNFKYAQVWGSSAKHDGQRVGVRHKLKDKDVLMIVS